MSCDMVPYLRYEKSCRVHHFFFALILSVRLAMSSDMVPHLRYEKSCRVHHFFASFLFMRLLLAGAEKTRNFLLIRLQKEDTSSMLSGR